MWFGRYSLSFQRKKRYFRRPWRFFIYASWLQIPPPGPSCHHADKKWWMDLSWQRRERLNLDLFKSKVHFLRIVPSDISNSSPRKTTIWGRNRFLELFPSTGGQANPILRQRHQKNARGFRGFFGSGVRVERSVRGSFEVARDISSHPKIATSWSHLIVYPHPKINMSPGNKQFQKESIVFHNQQIFSGYHIVFGGVMSITEDLFAFSSNFTGDIVLLAVKATLCFEAEGIS